MNARLDLAAWFKSAYAPHVPDAPAPLEAVAGTFASIDAHLSAQQAANEPKPWDRGTMAAMLRMKCSEELAWKIELAAVRWPACFEWKSWTLADAMEDTLPWDSMSEQEADEWMALGVEA